MTRYSEIQIAGLASATYSPAGDWTIAETGNGILTALTALLGATDAAAVLDVAYIYDFPYAGEFRNVATQHVVDAYVYPRDPVLGYYVEYSGYVARDDGSGYIHIFAASAPSATHVQLGLVFVISGDTDFPLSPSQIGPGLGGGIA